MEDRDYAPTDQRLHLIPPHPGTPQKRRNIAQVIMIGEMVLRLVG